MSKKKKEKEKNKIFFFLHFLTENIYLVKSRNFKRPRLNYGILRSQYAVRENSNEILLKKRSLFNLSRLSPSPPHIAFLSFYLSIRLFSTEAFRGCRRRNKKKKKLYKIPLPLIAEAMTEIKNHWNYIDSKASINRYNFCNGKKKRQNFYYYHHSSESLTRG